MMTSRFGYNENSLVIEVASNDGYLLQYFKQKNIPVLGIEPTANTAQAAKEKGIDSKYSVHSLALDQSASSKTPSILISSASAGSGGMRNSTSNKVLKRCRG